MGELTGAVGIVGGVKVRVDEMGVGLPEAAGAGFADGRERRGGVAGPVGSVGSEVGGETVVRGGTFPRGALRSTTSSREGAAPGVRRGRGSGRGCAEFGGGWWKSGAPE